jgi:S1-C subfamily serine protease
VLDEDEFRALIMGWVSRRRGYNHVDTGLPVVSFVLGPRWPAFLLGLRGRALTPAPRRGAPRPRPCGRRRPAALRLPAWGAVNFADVAERLNPAVVNIDATARGGATSGSGGGRGAIGPGHAARAPEPTPPARRRQRFIIDPTGFILTNHHVIAAPSGSP